MTERMVRSSLMVSATRASRTCHRKRWLWDSAFMLHLFTLHLAVHDCEALPHHAMQERD